MKSNIVLVLLVGSILLACSPPKSNVITNSTTSLDIQGHRGARGVFPENSIPGFLYALKLGVTTLELDLVVSADSQLIVSHEPYMSAIICRDSLGGIPHEADVYKNNIFTMTVEEIQSYDCGSTYHPRFDQQEKLSTFKPTLGQVIDTVESVSKLLNRTPVLFNIEIKSQQSTDDIFHPNPKKFSDLVAAFVHNKRLWDRVIIQSFDFRVLQYFHSKYPQAKLALLVENELSHQINIDSLGFVPNIYSPYFELLNEWVIDQLHEKKCVVIPWTVNEPKDLERMIEMKVDGIISDNPQRVLDIFKIN